MITKVDIGDIFVLKPAKIESDFNWYYKIVKIFHAGEWAILRPVKAILIESFCFDKPSYSLAPTDEIDEFEPYVYFGKIVYVSSIPYIYLNNHDSHFILQRHEEKKPWSASHQQPLNTLIFS